MPATIVVGGQYGSEGKGKVVALTARGFRAPWVVRCGGPNSGHSTSVDGMERVLRQLPAAAGQSDATLALAAGCVVDEQLLIEEIHACRLPRNRVIVDPRAILLDDADCGAEGALISAIGGTGSGNGAALARRMLRSPGVRLVESSTELREHVTVRCVAPELHDVLDRGGDVVVEGTQGFGLSLLHGAGYPFVTSKDTTASAFAAEAGLSPRQIDEIVLVIRTFPIRVGGNSGVLPNEISWADIQSISGAPNVEPEYTSVTRKLRRVGRFDIELVKAACRYNQPTCLAIMGLDRLDHRVRNARDRSDLADSCVAFMSMLKAELDVPIRWVGTGFKTNHAMDLHASQRVVRAHV